MSGESSLKIGIGSYAYSWNIKQGMTAADVLGEGIRYGVDVVQLCDNLDLKSIDWPLLASKAKSNGIELQIGNMGGPEDVIYAANVANMIGSPIVRFVIGPSFVAQSVSEVADDFRDAARICQENGARLALENHDFFAAKELAQIIDQIGHGCAANLDTANSLSTLEGTESIVMHLGPKSICLHAKDIAIEREFHMLGFRVFGVPAGRGSVDFRYLKENLPVLESIILEQWTPPVNHQPSLANENNSVLPGLEFLRGVWAT